YHYQDTQLPVYDDGRTLEESTSINYNIDWDSFELGVKIADAWWFDGDICEEGENHSKKTFTVRHKRGIFWIEYQYGGTIPLEMWCNKLWEGPTKVIGNIHETPDAANT
ncbi:MAG: hypothetical protein NUV49_03550, partial [Patescibacteria group bacterium]|nr:hypothetical protein [Patescibacteria group bacterium]